MHVQHLSISLEYFERGEGFDKVVVQVSAVGALLHIAVFGEVLHSHPHVHHWLATVLAVATGLQIQSRCTSFCCAM